MCNAFGVEEILDHVQGKLPPERERELLKHLPACASCRAAVVEMSAIARLPETPAIEPSLKIDQALRAVIASEAARRGKKKTPSRVRLRAIQRSHANYVFRATVAGLSAATVLLGILAVYFFAAPRKSSQTTPQVARKVDLPAPTPPKPPILPPEPPAAVPAPKSPELPTIPPPQPPETPVAAGPQEVPPKPPDQEPPAQIVEEAPKAPATLSPEPQPSRTEIASIVIGDRRGILEERQKDHWNPVKERSYNWNRGRPLRFSHRPGLVAFPDGATLAMNTGTEVELAGFDPIAILLRQGEVYCTVPKGEGKVRWIVRTRDVEVRVTGTAFAVADAESRTEVSVVEGEVICANDRGEVAVGAGLKSSADRASAPSAAVPFDVKSLCPWRRQIREVPAARAVDFLDSIGVNTHMGHSVDNVPKTATALSFAGFRCVRDGDNTSPGFVNDLIQVHKQIGVKFVLVKSSPNDAWMTDVINASKTLASAGALLALEGPNEPNNWPVTYQGVTSNKDVDFLPVAKWQAEFYRRCKADPVLKNYPVFHSSEAGGEPNNVGLQYLTIPTPLPAGVLMPPGTRFSDYANLHNHLNRKALSDNMAWENASSDQVGWADGIHMEYGHTWKKNYPGYTNSEDRWALPKVSTETGWPVGSYGLTEEQQGRLFLNVYLSQFKQGFKHTFIYILRDTPAEPGKGFFDANYSAKKAGTYLHNLTAILNDTGSLATPGSLDYSIPGPPAAVHDLLLQKSNGRFYLAVWNERVSGSDDVTVNLGGSRATAKIYDPTVGLPPIQTLNNVGSIPLTLSDHPVIVELTLTTLAPKK